jgi:hypothetical protein
MPCLRWLVKETVSPTSKQKGLRNLPPMSVLTCAWPDCGTHGSTFTLQCRISSHDGAHVNSVATKALGGGAATLGGGQHPCLLLPAMPLLPSSLLPPLLVHEGSAWTPPHMHDCTTVEERQGPWWCATEIIAALEWCAKSHVCEARQRPPSPYCATLQKPLWGGYVDPIRCEAVHAW